MCLNKQELKVYKTEYKYMEINDHFSETFIGKVVQNATFMTRSVDVYAATTRDIEHKFRIQTSIPSVLKECIFPRCPVGPTSRTRYKILNLSREREIQALKEEAKMKELKRQQEDQAGVIRDENDIEVEEEIDLSDNNGELVREYSYCMKE